jgi:hypothetical protein
MSGARRLGPADSLDFNNAQTASAIWFKTLVVTHRWNTDAGPLRYLQDCFIFPADNLFAVYLYLQFPVSQDQPPPYNVCV